MKRKWLIDVVVAAVAVAALLVWLFCFPPVSDAPTNAPEPSTPVTTEPSEPAEEDDVYIPNSLSFAGKVLEVDGDSVLMDCYDKNRFDTVWVNVSATGITPQVGEEYTVTYEDMMMPSLPPRITAVKMTAVVTTITPSSSTTSTTRTTKTTNPPETVPTPGKGCPDGQHDWVQETWPATCVAYEYKVTRCQRCSSYKAEKLSDEFGPHTFEKGSDTCSVCEKRFLDEYLKNWLLNGHGKKYPGVTGLAYDLGDDFYLAYDEEKEELYVCASEVINGKDISHRLILKDEESVSVYCALGAGMRCDGEYRYLGNNSIQMVSPLEYSGIKEKQEQQIAMRSQERFVHNVRDKLKELITKEKLSLSFNEFRFCKEK